MGLKVTDDEPDWLVQARAEGRVLNEGPRVRLPDAEPVRADKGHVVAHRVGGTSEGAYLRSCRVAGRSSRCRVPPSTTQPIRERGQEGAGKSQPRTRHGRNRRAFA